MSEVIVAAGAGFCPGVRTATDRLAHRMREAAPGERLYTLGHLIHNEDYNRDLEAAGVCAVGAEELPAIAAATDAHRPATVFIRAHGIPKETGETLERLRAAYPYFFFEDCTCPFVAKLHRIAAEHSAREGRARYIFLCIGSEHHPEVEGFMSCFEGEKYVFPDAAALEEGLKGLNLSKKVPVMVAQTTQKLTEWKKCQKVLKKLCTNAFIFDTICNVTDLRQTEAAKLARECDGMIVIGGKESSNTAKLYEICRSLCPDTLRVTGRAELPLVKPFALTHRKVGLTAGASTPSDIIEEVHKTMSETENFAELLDSTPIKTLNTGEIVSGTVMHVTDTELQLDLGAGVTGYIKAERVTDDPSVKLTEAYKVGDVVEAKVIRVSDVDGVAELDKRRVDSGKNWAKIVAAKEEGTVLEAPVADVVKGGLTVFVFGNRVFIPASQSGVPKDGDLAPLKGTTVKFKIIETKEPGNKAIGSIRAVLREERRAKEEEFWASIEEGKTYTGAVKSMTSYGAFIDLGGVDGMVHTSELSWKRIKSPADVLSIGDTVTVFVKSFDKEKKRISLGYKTEESNPWFIFTNNYQVGDVVPVKIVSMMPFGAFAEIIDGVDGLIHISQIAMTRIGKPADVLEIGQNVDAKIIEIDNDKQKVSLSIRALLEEVAAAEAAMPEDMVADEQTAE
ncbi:MAG: 4-hydroxy-3-methylbut-2-enyl diphosphate reductase [Clostridia bacterium]|nr:4-hydroxy-3-methylbut-2-enyl diphosphate reductase [Clostridia bacterium]